jgi:hypothetical protein
VTSIALAIGVLLVLIIALLAVPLTIVFSIHRIEETQGRVHFRWLFGLVRFQLRFPQPTRAESRPKPRTKTTARSSGRSWKKGKPGGILALLKQPAFRRRAYRFLRDLLTASRAQDLFLRLRIGTGDPADTGRLWAIMGPIAAMAQTLQSAEVHIEPEFTDPLFEVESRGHLRLVPIQFIALATAFMLSPTVLRECLRWHRGDT